MRVEVVDKGASAHLSNLVIGLGLLVTQLKDSKCTKIRQLLRHKDVGLLTHECVSEDEGLRKEILSKAHHSLNTVHSGSTKMYKVEERSGLEFRACLSSSSLQATFGMPPYEALYGVKHQSPLYWDSVGRKQRWGLK